MRKSSKDIIIDKSTVDLINKTKTLKRKLLDQIYTENFKETKNQTIERKSQPDKLSITDLHSSLVSKASQGSKSSKNKYSITPDRSKPNKIETKRKLHFLKNNDTKTLNIKRVKRVSTIKEKPNMTISEYNGNDSLNNKIQNHT